MRAEDLWRLGGGVCREDVKNISEFNACTTVIVTLLRPRVIKLNSSTIVYSLSVSCSYAVVSYEKLKFII
jgi:hypothetical protein